MRIPRPIARKLLGLTQVVLSKIELGQERDAKIAVIKLAAEVSAHTAHPSEPLPRHAAVPEKAQKA